jgi:phosphonate transport system permease protein
VSTSQHLRDPAARGRLTGAVVALALLWPLLRLSDFNPLLLVDPANLKPLGNYLATFLPPSTDAFFLQMLAKAVFETVAIATAGMALAFALAVPLGALATRALSQSAIGPAPTRWPGRALRAIVRVVLLFLRGIPELIWALLFVRFFGLGPAAAVLALGLTYGGMLGKVYGEILDSTDHRAARALLESGSSRFGALLFGLIPNAASELVSYTVYRWECAVRASVIMGFVGAGGLGQLMDQAMKMLNGSEAASILIAFFVLVWLADMLSNALRRLIDHRRPVRDAALAPARPLALGAGLAALLAVIVAAFAALGLSPVALARQTSWHEFSGYVGEFFPPDLSLDLIAKAADGAVQTFAISLLGTLLAVAAGALFALPASGRFGPAARRATRSVLNVLRSVPELVWATQTVLAAGIGPFAGTLALALHTTGVLGRLYAEALENAPPETSRALREAGAPRAMAFLYGTLPQIVPQWLAYGLYRWEINIRMAAVLGFVGAGGLGQMLYYELSLLHYPQVATIVGAALVLALIVDGISGVLRKRLR